MTASIPKFWSRRFIEAFWYALSGDPTAAFAGIYWFATGRRVRGWSRISISAARSPGSYKRWIDHGEPKLFEQYRLSSVPGRLQLSVLLLADNYASHDAARSITSLRTAFGQELKIFALSSGVPGCVPLPIGRKNRLAEIVDFFSREEGLWLLPALAGDTFSPKLADILAQAFSTTSADLMYWDEDKYGPEGREEPWIKPRWDPLLFEQLGGLAGCSVVSLNAVVAAAKGRSNSTINRNEMERLLFAIAIGSLSESPLHIPLILTHRSVENALPALADRYPLSPNCDFDKPWPSVSILLPTRDRPELLGAILSGIAATDYPGRIELIVIDNGTNDPIALKLIEEIATRGYVVILRDDGPFNFSRLNNAGVQRASGEILCFLNNDVEPLGLDWLKLMVRQAHLPDVGAVGAQLLYPSGRLQHGGVAIGLGGAAGHIQKHVRPTDKAFWTWHCVTREVSAVTAAVMVITRDRFLGVGGFDAEAFPVAFNDVDLCLRLKRAGFRNVYVAEARLLHRESETRGDDRSHKHSVRFASELKRLNERWHTEGYLDPHFSPLFSTQVEQCLLVS